MKARRQHRSPDPLALDMNGRLCAICSPPLPERVNRTYVMRSDCGNNSLFEHPDAFFMPIHSLNREAAEGQPETTAWCELNEQKICADAIYNKDFLYQAKAVDYPKEAHYDPAYCHYNGWLEPEIV